MNTLNKLNDTFDIMRRYAGGDMETQGVSIMLHVMQHDPNPLLVRELMDMVGVTHGSIIRYLRLLGSDDDHPRGGQCAGVIQCIIDPTDKRRKIVQLSTLGRMMRAEIAHIWN